MRFPLGFYDISLWMVISAIILLATSEFISPYYGCTSLIIEKDRLRSVALVLGFLFFSTIVIRIYQILLAL